MSMKQSILLGLSFAIGGTCSRFTNADPPPGVDVSNETNCGPQPCVTFDETDQHNGLRDGVYKFIAPKHGDQRGPCPGLNAAANHGHIPRNGVVTIEEATAGLNALYNMGTDLASLSAAYAVAVAGDVGKKTFSIGGPVNGIVGNGLSHSHNVFEGDASPARLDAYLNGGNADSLDMTKFNHLWDQGVFGVFGVNHNTPQYNWNFTQLRQHLKYSQQRSIATNPHFFSAPFSGTTVVPHTFYFLMTLVSSHTDLRPNGYLADNTLGRFYGISGNPRGLNGTEPPTPPTPFEVHPGQESLGPSWSRRPSSVPYGIADSIADLILGYRDDPSTFLLGGNTGKVKSFKSVSVSDLTYGTYSNETLFTGNNFACFSLQSMLAGLPGKFNGGAKHTLSAARKLLNEYVQPHLTDLNCPSVNQFNLKLFEQFPGYKP